MARRSTGVPGKMVSWKGCKPNSVCGLAAGENHLSERSTRTPARLRGHRREPRLGSQLDLAPDGVCRAPALALGAVRSYRTFSPWPPVARRWSESLWHCPSARLPANRPRVSPAEPELRGIALCGVRTFLPRQAASDSPPFRSCGDGNAAGSPEQGRGARPRNPPVTEPPRAGWARHWERSSATGPKQRDAGRPA